MGDCMAHEVRVRAMMVSSKRERMVIFFIAGVRWMCEWGKFSGIREALDVLIPL
jgi:hypothetical protein